MNSANMFENLSVITWRSRRLTPGVGRNEMWRDSMLPYYLLESLATVGDTHRCSLKGAVPMRPLIFALIILFLCIPGCGSKLSSRITVR